LPAGSNNDKGINIKIKIAFINPFKSHPQKVTHNKNPGAYSAPGQV
jgi:hypothetical protein